MSGITELKGIERVTQVIPKRGNVIIFFITDVPVLLFYLNEDVCHIPP